MTQRQGQSEELSQQELEAMAALRAQLMQAAEQFSGDSAALSALLEGMVSDVERASAEPLEIVPVAHHSPSCALHMVRRLRQRAPRVIFMEGCEDMMGLLPKLAECRLPVALQAFASESDAFPEDWAPLTVVLPLTPFSAEFQAIAYAQSHEGVALVFVDRSVDHIFQQLPKRDDAVHELAPDGEALAPELDDDEDDEDAASADEARGGPRVSHGSALGVELGSVVPTFEAFEQFLLRNANVRHFSEWWDQYVEQALLSADYATFRRVMLLIGSLMRRLGRRPEDIASDQWRERYMWSRIKDYLATHQIDPRDAMYVCGAVHAVSDVEQFGVASEVGWEVPERTKTPWLYGLVPSSYSAIERQFNHPAGTVSLAEATWKKGLEGLKLKPFALTKKPSARVTGTRELAIDGASAMVSFMTQAPDMSGLDEEQLLNWCVDIVKLARKHGYLANTADAIAIYQTAQLLAGMRNRQHPSPNDFKDAAVTCLEKNRVPKRRDVAMLCNLLLGGDRVGRVGYDAMPPLARDVYDQLAVLPINVQGSTVQRALMDFKLNPEYLPASQLLWKLHYLLTNRAVVRPIMGERALGQRPIQESWDIAIGRYQSSVIELGYEGVTVDQVLEQRLKKRAFGPKASTIDALEVTEASILYLKGRRLTQELGERAVDLLRLEPSAHHAPDIFARVRKLVHYYRAQPTGLAPWIKDFVLTGYQHFATLLPQAFQDGDTSPEEIAGMLAFVFTLESLALSLGCDRSQLVIAIRQASQLDVPADKLGLLWSAQYLLGERSLSSIRAFFDEALANPLVVRALPSYISGFVQALAFTPLVGRLVVELLSKAFERLPDRVLMPWLPGLVMTLKPLANELLPSLIKDASSLFPAKVAGLQGWQAPWDMLVAEPDAPADTSAGAPQVEVRSAEALAIGGLLRAHREVTQALAERLGVEAPDAWPEPQAEPPAAASAPSTPAASVPIATLLTAHPEVLNALLERL